MTVSCHERTIWTTELNVKRQELQDKYDGIPLRAEIETNEVSEHMESSGRALKSITIQRTKCTPLRSDKEKTTLLRSSHENVHIYVSGPKCKHLCMKPQMYTHLCSSHTCTQLCISHKCTHLCNTFM